MLGGDVPRRPTPPLPPTASASVNSGTGVPSGIVSSLSSLCASEPRTAVLNVTLKLPSGLGLPTCARDDGYRHTTPRLLRLWLSHMSSFALRRQCERPPNHMLERTRLVARRSAVSVRPPVTEATISTRFAGEIMHGAHHQHPRI